MFEKKRDFNHQRLKFKGGEGSLALKKRDVIQLVADAFDNSLYNLVSKERNNRLDRDRHYYQNREDKLYYNNSKFWTETLLSYNAIGQRIRLKHFSVIEWLPSSPGLFFTGKAEVARRKAESYFNPSHREYLPLGKLEMILGGIGSTPLS